MGELDITISDLDKCSKCNRYNQLIFQNAEGWWIACGYRKCKHQTGIYEELLDAADIWGLKANDEILEIITD